jgi:ABC-type cobalamin/Fe3+-siderophores transport system ATPase subunit
MLSATQIGYSINDKVILKDISFAINKGDFFSIIGPNGSGKSTLLKIILGIINDYTGKVSIEND